MQESLMADYKKNSLEPLNNPAGLLCCLLGLAGLLVHVALGGMANVKPLTDSVAEF